ncbi:MAG: GntR family transcriptional regulator [Acidimicrobiaceae bacterium]|nr:GntR family transcriptional regulator [Acidimicrobiaceae bacterium]
MTGPVSLDRNSPVLLWMQLAQDLRRRLAEGEFDQRFPSENDCVLEYGVSRQTVREALRRMEADGLLVRNRGSRTILSRPEFEQPLHAMYSLSRSLQSQGAIERSKVLAIRQIPADHYCDELAIKPGEPVVYLDRLRFADEEPLAVMRSWLPVDIGDKLVEAELESGSLYDLLAEKCHIRVTGGWERMWPVNPSPEDRKLLRLPKGQVALAVQRLAMSGNRPIEWRETTIRGDRYSFKAEWMDTSTSR